MTLLFPRTALGTTLTALALGCTAISAQTGGAPDSALACGVDVSPRGGLLAIEGTVAASEAVAGTYHLRVERRGALMNQGGAFALAAGETETLGRITMNGPSAGLSIDLTLTVDGRTLRCPVDL